MLDQSEIKAIKKFIAKYPRFHVTLDNDVFFLSSEKAPDWETATDADYTRYEKRVKNLTVYSSPVALLILLIDELGGTSANV